MALFQFNNQVLPYQIEFAPFSFDLLLLQSSRFNVDLWRDVLEMFSGQSAGGGRIVTCEWRMSGLNDEEQAEFIYRFVQTLGLVTPRVVAVDDAVEVVGDIERQHPATFAKTLLFAQSAPKGEELTAALRSFVV